MDYRNIDHHEDEDLLLEELVPHGEEGNGQPTAEEEDEVQSQLVPIVDGERKVVPWRRKTMSTLSYERG